MSVTPLREIPSIPISSNVVEIIEEVLEAAKSGKVSMVAIATVEPDGAAQRA